MIYPLCHLNPNPKINPNLRITTKQFRKPLLTEFTRPTSFERRFKKNVKAIRYNWSVWSFKWFYKNIIINFRWTVVVKRCHKKSSCIPPSILSKAHFSRQYNCWSVRCGWGTAGRRCSNYIFILDLTPGFSGMGKYSCMARREIIKCLDLVRLILED